MATGVTALCRFALVPDHAVNLRHGVAPMEELAALVAEAKQIVLLLAASDVTLLRLATPPLSADRLKAALSALVEDRLLCDPTECALAASGETDGQRTVAVTDCAWLNELTEWLYRMGARRIVAVPFQLCLPDQSNTVSALVDTEGACIELSVRTGENDGVGLLLAPDASAQEIIRAIRLIEPQAPVTLHVPAERIGEYSQFADSNITVVEGLWARWVAGAKAAGINLMDASGMRSKRVVDWKPWRWPLALAATVVLVNVLGVQIDWWRMRSEEQDLRVALLQSFKAAYPQEKAIVDPVAQMQQKLAIARNRAGQLASDDFLAMSAALNEAWAGAAQARKLPAAMSGIASLEYRERSLLVKWKTPSPIAIEEMQPVLAARNLSLSKAADAWQIRSMK